MYIEIATGSELEKCKSKEKLEKLELGSSLKQFAGGEVSVGRGRKCIRKFCDGETTFLLVKYHPNFSAMCQIYFVYVWNIMESYSL